MDIPIQELAQFRATSREECGIFVGNGREISRIVYVENVAEDDEDFAISTYSLLQVKKELRKGEVMMGFIHTHLPHHEASPTKTDFAGAAIHPDALHCVYKPSTGEYEFYRNLTEENAGT